MSPICGILRTSFDGYLSDTLPAPQRRILREHLAACVPCRDLAAAQDPTFLFARPMREDVSASDGRRILAAVKTGVSFLETERRIGHTTRRRFAGGAAAAAAVAVLLLATPGGPARRGPSRALPRGAAVRCSGRARSETAVFRRKRRLRLESRAGREEPRVMWIVDRGPTFGTLRPKAATLPRCNRGK